MDKGLICATLKEASKLVNSGGSAFFQSDKELVFKVPATVGIGRCIVWLARTAREVLSCSARWIVNLGLLVAVHITTPIAISELFNGMSLAERGE